MDDHSDAVRRLMLAINRIDGIYYLFSKNQGSNENTYALLYAISDGQPHSQKQVCEEWLIPKTTINTITRNLVKEGYLTLLPGTHTKEKTICLTPAGKAYTETIMKGVCEAEQQALKDTLERFSPEFIDAFDCFSARVCEELRRRMQEV